MKKYLWLLFLLCPLFLSAKTTVLYHTSDVHGFFYPREGRGGFAALKAVLNGEKRPFLLLDSGDFANGTAETRSSKGLKAVEMMNRMGYDAATVGNHEFDFTEDGLAPLFEKADFAVLAANLRNTDSGGFPAFAQPYRVFEADGVRVGVVGLANRKPAKPVKKYRFSKPLEALEKALAAMESQKPDVVVVLAHDSLADYKNGILPYMGDIALKYGGRVHAVLGGHAHKIFQNEYINGVLFVESGSYLTGVSRITVETDDETGKFVSAKSELIPLVTAKTGEDPEIKAFADALREPGIDEVLGFAGETLAKKPADSSCQDGALDDWVADLGRSYSGAEVFIHNTGGTRVDMKKGPVTLRSLTELFPFDDSVVLMRVSGRMLKKFIKDGLLPWNKYTYSGLTVSYRKGKTGKVRDLAVSVNGKPLENRKIYTVGTNSFVAGHKTFSRVADKKSAGPKTVRALLEDALENGPVFPPRTGRIVRLAM